MRLAGAASAPRVFGQEPRPGKVNYFIGRDPEGWRTDIPTYARVRYATVYPGVDLVYYGNQGRLEYDFIVAPGADPSQIRLRFEGADKLELDDDRNLILHLGDAQVLQAAPVIYQRSNEPGASKQFIDGRYVLGDDGEVSFDLEAYDDARPLVIDPVLVYSSYLGGTAQDRGDGITVDSAGSAYGTGFTLSNDFPTQNPIQAAIGGTQSDAFVTKISPDALTLIYSTYLGGAASGDLGYDIAVDADGNAYVTGAAAGGFPTTAGAFQTVLNGNGDVFVTKLNAAGNALVYSTYIGGERLERGFGIALDETGAAYVTGQTSSNEFPVPNNAFQPSHTVTNAGVDCFVAKVDPAGSALPYSTYLGGQGEDRCFGIVVDHEHHAYVTGLTQSGDYPTTPGSLQPVFGGALDAVVTKLNADGTDVIYSTFLGGGSIEQGHAIALDFAHNAYVTGEVQSRDFPTTPGAFQTEFGGNRDAFVTKINAAGSELVYSTYLGGAARDHGHGIAVDRATNAYVDGWTVSRNFPLASPLDASGDGSDGDAFFTKLNYMGSALLFSTYLGGVEQERVGGDSGDGGGNHIAIDDACKMYGAGSTQSDDFPTMGPFQAARSGNSDGFVAKIDPENNDGDPTIGYEATVLANLSPLLKMISRNSIITIFGRDFAGLGVSIISPELDAQGNITTMLGNTCVEANGERLPMFSVNPNQINAQASHLLALGYAEIRVIRNCGTNPQFSAPDYVQVKEQTPAFLVFFVGSVDGNFPIAALHLDFSVVAEAGLFAGATPADQGEIISLFGTGIPLTDPVFPAGVLPPVARQISGDISLTVGGIEVPRENIAYIGVAPFLAGVFQLVFTVPAGLPPGNHQVVLTINGVSTPLGPFITVV